MIMMLKSGTGHNFLKTAKSLERQRKLGTNIVVIKRVDCIFYLFDPYKYSSGSHSYLVCIKRPK